MNQHSVQITAGPLPPLLQPRPQVAPSPNVLFYLLPRNEFAREVLDEPSNRQFLVLAPTGEISIGMGFHADAANDEGPDTMATLGTEGTIRFPVERFPSRNVSESELIFVFSPFTGQIVLSLTNESKNRTFGILSLESGDALLESHIKCRSHIIPIGEYVHFRIAEYQFDIAWDYPRVGVYFHKQDLTNKVCEHYNRRIVECNARRILLRPDIRDISEIYAMWCEGAHATYKETPARDIKSLRVLSSFDPRGRTHLGVETYFNFPVTIKEIVYPLTSVRQQEREATIAFFKRLRDHRDVSL